MDPIRLWFAVDRMARATLSRFVPLQARADAVNKRLIAAV